LKKKTYYELNTGAIGRTKILALLKKKPYYELNTGAIEILALLKKTYYELNNGAIEEDIFSA
jgi:hypothetical protein